MGFSRQEHWSGLPFPPPGDFLNSRIKPKSLVSPALQADSLPAEPSGKPKVLVAQSCPTLCDSMDCSPPGSSIHRVLQARILEQVPIAFSSGPSQLRDQTRVICVAGRLFTIWAPGSPKHRLSSCGAWSGLLCDMWDLPRSGIEPVSLALAGGFFYHWATREVVVNINWESNLKRLDMVVSRQTLMA